MIEMLLTYYVHKSILSDNSLHIHTDTRTCIHTYIHTHTLLYTNDINILKYALIRKLSMNKNYNWKLFFLLMHILMHLYH